MSMLNESPVQSEIVKVRNPFWGEEIEINLNELKGKTPTKAGDKYPNLVSQVSYASESAERHKESMLQSVEKLFNDGSEAINMCLDAIYHYVENEKVMLSDLDEVTLDDMENVSSKVYQMIGFVKVLFEIYEERRYFGESFKEIQSAQKGILL